VKADPFGARHLEQPRDAAEHDDDLAAVAFEDLLVAVRDDQLR